MTSETPWGDNGVINITLTEKEYTNSVVNYDIDRAFDIFSHRNDWDSYFF